MLANASTVRPKVQVEGLSFIKKEHIFVTEKGSNDKNRWQVNLRWEGEGFYWWFLYFWIRMKQGYLSMKHWGIFTSDSPWVHWKCPWPYDFSISVPQPRHRREESTMMGNLKFRFYGRCNERVRGNGLFRHWQEGLKWWNVGFSLDRERMKVRMIFSGRREGPDLVLTW